MMHLTSVLLPAPFSPSNACTVPGSRRSDTSSSTVRPPKLFVIPRAWTRGGTPRVGGTGEATETCIVMGVSEGRALPCRGELGRHVGGSSRRRTAGDQDDERQHVGRRIEEVVSCRDADRLQRRAERARAAEE